MNNDDERDYAEEAANRALLRERDDDTELAVWLLEQIYDDERTAKEIVNAAYASYSATWTEPSSAVVDTGDEDIHTGDRLLNRHIVRWDPARVLIECDQKRKIVAMHAHHEPCRTMRFLAASYTDRAGWREEWKA